VNDAEASRRQRGNGSAHNHTKSFSWVDFWINVATGPQIEESDWVTVRGRLEKRR
jgi:hypothetical protein